LGLSPVDRAMTVLVVPKSMPTDWAAVGLVGIKKNLF
jgi:hypothetical protein